MHDLKIEPLSYNYTHTQKVAAFDGNITGLEETTVEDKKPRDGRLDRNLDAVSSEDDASIPKQLIIPS